MTMNIRIEKRSYDVMIIKENRKSFSVCLKWPQAITPKRERERERERKKEKCLDEDSMKVETLTGSEKISK